MHDLYPTKTRLALLRHVAAGIVYKHTHDGSSTTNAGFTRVTARIAEAEQAGWVELEEADHLDTYPLRVWRLTDAGRAILDQADADA